MAKKKKQKQDLIIEVVRCDLTRNTETFGQMDPFVIVKINDTEKQTMVMDEAGKDAHFGATLEFPLWVMQANMQTDVVKISVLDKDTLTNDLVGSFETNINSLIKEKGEHPHDLFYNGEKAGTLSLWCYMK